MTTLTARLEEWLRDAIVTFWREHDAGPSSALRRVAEEWWAMNTYPRIRFRDGVSGRRAVLQGGPDVWEVVSVARSYAGDLQKLYDHFAPYVEPGAIDQALAYAGRFPDDVEAMIAGNERLERHLRNRQPA
jgi:hypothetical protein